VRLCISCLDHETLNEALNRILVLLHEGPSADNLVV